MILKGKVILSIKYTHDIPPLQDFLPICIVCNEMSHTKENVESHVVADRHGRLETDGTPKHGILLFHQDTVNKPLIDYWEINRVYYRLLTDKLDRHWSEQNVKHCHWSEQNVKHCHWSIIQLQMVSDNSVIGAPFIKRILMRSLS